MVAMPAACAWCGLSKVTSWPSMRMVPVSGLWTPEMTLMSVDLPAPFSPTRAWISPAATAKDDVLQGPDTRELLADALELEQRGHAVSVLLPSASATPGPTGGPGAGVSPCLVPYQSQRAR